MDKLIPLQISHRIQKITWGYGPLLQLAEEVPHKHSVVGSSPTWSTRKT